MKIIDWNSSEEEKRKAYDFYVKILESHNDIIEKLLRKNGKKYGVGYCKFSEVMNCHIYEPNYFSLIDIMPYELFVNHLANRPLSETEIDTGNNDKFIKMAVQRFSDYGWTGAYYTFGEVEDDE